MNIPGGIKFDTQSLNLGGSASGPLSVSTSANNINFNSFGATTIQGAGNVDITAAAGDSFLRSIQGSLSFSSGNNAALDSGSIVLDARHSNGGVFFNASGSLTSQSGVGTANQRQTGFSSNYLSVSGGEINFASNNGSFEADSAGNINLSGQQTRVNPSGSLLLRSDIGGAFFQGGSVSFSSTGSLVVNSQSEVSLVSLAGAGTISSIQNVNLQSQGSLSVSSFNGPIGFNSDTTFSVLSGQEVIVNAQGTMNLNSGQNIYFTANDAIDYFTVGDLSFSGASVTLTSNLDLLIESIDLVLIHSTSTLNFISTGGSLTLDAGNKLLLETMIGSLSLTAPIQLLTSQFLTDVQAIGISSTLTGNLVIDSVGGLFINAVGQSQIHASSSLTINSPYSSKWQAQQIMINLNNQFILNAEDTVRFDGGSLVNLDFSDAFMIQNTFDMDVNTNTLVFNTSSSFTLDYSGKANVESVNTFMQNTNFRTNSVYSNFISGGNMSFLVYAANIQSTNDMNFNATQSTSISLNTTLNINANRNFYADFNGNASINAATSFFLSSQGLTFSTGKNLYLSGGTGTFQGQTIDFHSLASASFSAQNLTINTDSINMQAIDGPQSDLSWQNSGSSLFVGNTIFSQSGLDTSFNAAQQVNISTADFTINNNVDPFLTLKSRSNLVDFTAGSIAAQIAGPLSVTTTNQQIQISGQNSVILSASSDVSITLESALNNFNIGANNTVSITTTGPFFGNGGEIDFDFNGNVSFHATGALSINSFQTINFESEVLSSLSLAGNNNQIQATSFVLQGSNNVQVTGQGSLDLNGNYGDISFQASGGGIAWNSSSSFEFDSGSAFSSTSKGSMSVVSQNNTNIVTQGQGAFYGGSISASSGRDINFLSAGGIEGTSGNHRFTGFVATQDFTTQFASDLQIQSYSNITVVAPQKNANVCITAETSVQYISQVGTYLTAFSSNSSFSSQQVNDNSGSIALSSYGSQSDPLHLIPLGVPAFGAILRTVNGNNNITITSGAGTHFYAGTDVDFHSQSDAIINAQLDALIFSSDYLATTEIFSAGSLKVNPQNNLNVVAGTPEILADLYLNGTSVVLNALYASITQTGINSDVGRQGILFDSKLGSIILNNAGGGISFLSDSEEGSFYARCINGGFSSTSYLLYFTADTGTIDISARTGVDIFTNNYNSASFLNTVMNTTGGVGDIIISATQIISLTATNSFTLTTFQDLTIMGGTSISTSSNALSLFGGGSVSIDGVTGHILNAANNFVVNSGNEVSFEAEVIQFVFNSGPSSTVNIYASGDSTQTGLAVSSLGSVLLAASFNNTVTSATTDFQGNNLDINSNLFIHLSSGGGNPGSGDNMLLRSTNANFLFNSANDFTLASNQTTTILSGVSTFNSPVGFSFSSNYLTSFKADNGNITYTVSSGYELQSKNELLYQANNGSISFVTSNNIYISSNGEVTTQSNTDTSFTSGYFTIYTPLSTSETLFYSGESFNVLSLTTEWNTFNLDWYATTSFTDQVTGDINLSTFVTNFTTLGNNFYSADSFQYSSSQAIYLNGATNANLPLSFQGTNGISQTGADIYFIPYNNLVDTASDSQTFTATDVFVANVSNIYSASAPSIAFETIGSFSATINQSPTSYNAPTPFIDIVSQSITLISNSGDFKFVSQGSIDMNFATTATFTSSNGNLNIESGGGPEGIAFNANTIDFGTTNSLSVNGLDAIDFLTNGQLTFSGTQLTFNTSQNALANIYFEAGQGLTVTATTNLLIYANITGYPSNVNQGAIRFESPALMFSNALNFHFTSSRQTEFNSRGLLQITSTTAEIDSGRTVLFSSPTGIQNAATTAFSAQTTALLSDIVFSTQTFALTSAGYTSNIATTSGNVEFESAGATTITSTSTVSFSTTLGDLNLISEGGSVIFNSATGITATAIATKDIVFSASGSDGSIVLNPGTLDLSKATSLLFNTGSTFVLSGMPTLTVVNAAIFNAANDFHLYAGGGGLNVIATTAIDLATTTHFASLSDFTATAGQINVLGKSTIEIFAQGNLGNIAARSVIGGNAKGTPRTPYVAPTYSDYAIEFYSINGPVALDAKSWVGLYSLRGDVEFRGIAATRFDVIPGATSATSGRLGFFGQVPATFQQISITYEADYCLASNGCNAFSGCPYSIQTFGLCSGGFTCDAYCPDVSAAINNVLSALFAYGLIGCIDATTNGCAGFQTWN